MKTPEELANEFVASVDIAKTETHFGMGKGAVYAAEMLNSHGNQRERLKEGFLAGYQAAKDEEATKDQKIAALWAESIKNMLPSVHEIVLFPSDSSKASEANKARDAEIVAKMDAAINKAKDG